MINEKSAEYLQTQMDNELAKMQDQLVRKFTATGKSSNGLVSVTVSANHLIKDIKLQDPSIAAKNPDKLNQWIKEATNDAIFQVNHELERRTTSIVFNYLEKTQKISEK